MPTRILAEAAWSYDGTTFLITNASGIASIEWDTPSGGLKFHLTEPETTIGAVVRAWLSPKTNAPPGSPLFATGVLADPVTAIVVIATPTGPCIAGGSMQVVEISPAVAIVPTGTPPAPPPPPIVAGSYTSAVWRPGATPGTNVVSTGAQLKSFLAANPMVSAVQVDSTPASPAILLGTDGVLNLAGIAVSSFNPASESQITVNDGAQLRNLTRLDGVNISPKTTGSTPALAWDYISNAAGIELANGSQVVTDPACTASPILDGAAGSVLAFFTSSGSGFDNSATPAVPIVKQQTAGTFVVVESRGGVVLNGTNIFAGIVGTTFTNSFDDASDPVPPAALLGTNRYQRLSTDTRMQFFNGAVAPTPSDGLQIADMWWDTTVLPSGAPKWWTGAAWVTGTVT